MNSTPPRRSGLSRKVIRRLAACGLAIGLAAPISPISPFNADDAQAAARGRKKAKKAEPRKLDVELPIKEFTLENGLRLYVVEDHSTPAFNISMLYKVGSVDEVKGRTGFAHFFEHMMFMGSKNLGRFKVGENTENAGGNFNAFTSYDQTVYFHNLPSNYVDMVLWGESDRLRALDFTEEGFETQRAAVKSEKDIGDNRPYSKAIQEDMFGTVFEGTPYGHNVIGSLDDLNNAEVGDTKAFFDRYYMPNNCYMVVVGDVEAESFKAKVEQYFGDIPAGELPPPPAHKDQMRGRKIDKFVADDKAKQTIYVVGWPSVGDTHKDAPALALLGQILLGGESSRIPKILQDEKKYVVGAGGGHLSLIAGGMMFAQLVPKDGVSKAKIQEVVLEQIKLMAEKGPTDAELAKARNAQLMESLSTLATNNGRALAIAMGAAYHGDPKHVITQLDAYAKITKEDVQRAAREYVNENWVFYEVGPAK
jgi:zinc protease